MTNRSFRQTGARLGSWGVILLVGAVSCTSRQENTSTGIRASGPGNLGVDRPPGEERFADAHVHIIDFLQNGAFDNRDGRYAGVGERGQIKTGAITRYNPLRYGEQWRRLSQLLEDMDAGAVDQAMVAGLPFLKKWSANEPFARPRYYLDSDSQMVGARDTDYLIGMAFVDYQRVFADNGPALRRLERLHPFVCGFDSTDLGAVDLVVKRIKEFPGVWQGIGEVMSRHDDLTNLMVGERPRANHPALKRLCRFAGEWALPVSIHHNIAPISRNADEVKEPVYLDELVDLFAYCRPPDAGQETKFIWCHAGISRRVVVENLTHWIDRVLTHHRGQVFVDLSWVVYEDYITKDLRGWAALIARHPDSFMLGSDVVGDGKGIGKELARYVPLLDAISADPTHQVRRKLARDNFVNLMAEQKQRRRKKMEREGLVPDSGLVASGLLLRADYEFDETAHTGAPQQSFTKANRP